MYLAFTSLGVLDICARVYAHEASLIYYCTSKKFRLRASTVHGRSKHRPIALDLNRRTARSRPLLLRDLPSALPRRALEDLGERELRAGEPELGADGVGDAVAVVCAL